MEPSKVIYYIRLEDDLSPILTILKEFKVNFNS